MGQVAHLSTELRNPDTEWKKRCRDENIWSVLLKVTLQLHLQFFRMSYKI